jgi:uncharacterized protein YidB (DUF937 family)
MAPMDLGGGAKKVAGDVAAGAAGAPAGTEVTGAAPEEAVIGGLLGTGGTQLSGLMEKFGAAGLGEQAQSWVGKGSNLPVTADQIKSVLQSDQVAAVASKLGISPDQAADKIAGALPGIIDKVTPDGIVPDPDDLAGKLAGFAKQQMTK